MKKFFLSRVSNWVLYITMTVAVAAVLVASIVLINYLRKEEIKRVDIIASAMKLNESANSSSLTPDVQELILEIVENNDKIPIILTDARKNPIIYINIPKNIEENSAKLRQMVDEMEADYPPIEIKMPDRKNQFVYYTNSRLMNNLQYSPYSIAVLVLLYILFSFWFLKTLKKTDEGFLWAGLAKETAHQIATPLSSMIGWVEIMKIENIENEAVKEIEKDIYRLKNISERFSKIGSVPELSDLNLNETLQTNYDYLKSRISSKVNFQLHLPPNEILVPHNKILISWVMENLVKNAVDAMKGIGTLDITLSEKNKMAVIDFKDSGSGMAKSQIRKVFKPGFTTKPRGWGLGLSLAKRAVNIFHNGDIRILHSEIGKGTTFRITLRKEI